MKVINQKAKLAILFSIILIVFFIFDWFSKDYWFNADELNTGFKRDLTVIGIRSVAHYNTTLLSSLNISIPTWAHHVINLSLVSVFTIAIFFIKKRLTAVALGILVAGMLGNAMDKLFTANEQGITFVRDIFYVPWLKNGNLGTFNAADAFVVTGAILLAISTLSTLFKENKEEKKLKELKEKQAEVNENKELPEKEEVLQQIKEDNKKKNSNNIK